MMVKNKHSLLGKRIFFVFVVVSLFFAALIQVSSEERVRIGDMEKEEIGDDEESQETLREYYGELIGKVKTKPKFNNIAIQGTLAVINVTIDGKNSRILTRIKDSNIVTQQINYSYGDFITVNKLVVLGNISLKGNLFFEAENIFGPRRLFGVGSTTSRYVDEGFSRLVDGEATVSINPVLRELISSYNVFLSAEGLTRGIYVAEKTDSYFAVKSVNANSNVAFSWMLRGSRSYYDGGYLISRYGNEKGITITAEIYPDDGYTEIEINGLDKILALVNQTTVNNSNNNESNNQSINLITGNLIDEFGLETDLGQILSDTAPELPTIGEENSNEINNNQQNNDQNNNLNNNQTNNNNLINETNNETTSDETQTSTLEFTLQSVDEDFIVSQISIVTGLSSFEVKKLVNFVYAEPQGFSDEVVDTGLGLDFIEKVNGSVIIRLG